MERVPAFHTLPGPCEFYFVRHGESESNRSGRIQGHSDSPLSAEGRRHAEAAGAWFAGRRIDAILTSPLGRASDTARILAERAHGPEPQIEPDLIELDTGEFSGVAIRDLAKSDPELFQRFRMHSWEVVPGAERIPSLERRALAVWDRLLALAQEGKRRFICVSHGGTMQWLIKATTGFPGQVWMPLVEIANCGIFLFQAESTLPGRIGADQHDLSDASAAAASMDSGGVGALGGAGSAPGYIGTTVDPDELPNGAGHYGIWKLMNLVPYEQ